MPKVTTPVTRGSQLELVYFCIAYRIVAGCVVKQKDRLTGTLRAMHCAQAMEDADAGRSSIIASCTRIEHLGCLARVACFFIILAWH